MGSAATNEKRRSSTKGGRSPQHQAERDQSQETCSRPIDTDAAGCGGVGDATLANPESTRPRMPRPLAVA